MVMVLYFDCGWCHLLVLELEWIGFWVNWVKKVLMLDFVFKRLTLYQVMKKYAVHILKMMLIALPTLNEHQGRISWGS
jgi:hypothetical protein